MTTERIANPARRAISWCGDCKTWTPIEELGSCPANCEREDGQLRQTRKRLAYVCDECSCSYFNLDNYKEHTCHECY